MSRDHAEDTLLTLAFFLFICIHISGPSVARGMEDASFDASFWVGNLINAFSRIGVPLLVLISGRRLLGKSESFHTFFQKGFSEVCIPLCFWSLFYLLYKGIAAYTTQEGIDVNQLLLSLIQGRPFYHLWYLYMILGLYLITPVINLVLPHVEKASLTLIGLFFIVFGSILTYYDVVYENKPFFLLWFIYYLGYFILGYALRNTQIYPIHLLILGYLTSSLCIALGTYYTARPETPLYFYQYLSPYVVFGSLCVYKIFCQLSIKENPLSQISYLSLGIFLVHGGVLDILDRLACTWEFTPFLTYPFLEIMVKLGIVIGLSLLISFLLHCNKLLRQTL